MFGGINLFRLFHRSMIEPENNVMIIVKIRTSHRDGLIRVVGEDGQGASSIKTDAAYGGRVDALLVQNPLDRRANATPDIVG